MHIEIHLKRNIGEEIHLYNTYSTYICKLLNLKPGTKFKNITVKSDFVLKSRVMCLFSWKTFILGLAFCGSLINGRDAESRLFVSAA